MKKGMPFFSLGVIMLLCSTAAYAQQPMTVKMTKGVAQITSLRGEAKAICMDQTDPRQLKKNDRLSAGCEVSTSANSRLEMLLPDRSIVRFSEKTKFKLIQSDVGQDGKRTIKISVPVGKVWTNVRKALKSRDNTFEVSCQNAVAGVRGTVYRMDVENDQSAQVKVYDGEVDVRGNSRTQDATAPHPAAFGPPKPVSGPTAVAGPQPVSMEQWVYIVKSMQKIRISADGQAHAPEDFTEEEDMDDWVKWNRQRDKKTISE
ncbi:MAG TPA: FecR family protein [Smithellaceae bacterium]|jgi:hypothetical protein|nr:FecR family protein [Smithellaceae bacterium]